MFKVGDRVLTVAAEDTVAVSTPIFGQYGSIIAPSLVEPFEWLVALDTGAMYGYNENELVLVNSVSNVDGNKYIHFEQADSGSRKTEVWSVVSNSSGVSLGLVKWYGAWRQYCFYPGDATIFNVGCLETINAFITKLMSERRSSNGDS